MEAAGVLYSGKRPVLVAGSGRGGGPEAVAVPFVGMTAASLVIAEATRLLHDGPAYIDMKLSLGSPSGCSARTTGNYAAEDTAGVKFVEARRM
jgi:hypothetical protein